MKILNSGNFVESARSFMLYMVGIIKGTTEQDPQQFRYNLNDLYDSLKWLKDKANQEEFNSILIDPKIS